MSEHKIPIPSMIYNASVGGHVTNSQQIIDENLNREQQDINEEVAAVPYNASNPNGMGRIVLKKNDNFKQVVESQTNGNTIFVIRYNFTLTGDVTIPDNCVLEFDGGSINGETIQLNEGCSVVKGKFVECKISINYKNCSIINTSIVNTTKPCIAINDIIDINYPKDNLRIEECALKTSYDGSGSTQGCAIRWHINNSDLISKNISIINNRIEYTCMGFELTQSGNRTGRECLENAIFADNIFVHLPSETTAKYFAISLPDNFSDNVYCNKNVVISNNVINCNGIGRAFEVAGEKFIISGNTILNPDEDSLLASGFRTYTDESQETVYMKALRDSVISNNHFKSIYLQSVENVTIENNFIDGVLRLGDVNPKYYAEDVRIISNTINYNCVVDRDSGHFNYPIAMTNTKNVEIRSNILATNWSNGIIWTNSQSTVPLVNIVVSDNRVSLRGKYPFFITQDVVVSKNNLVEFDTFTELIDYRYGASKFGNSDSIPIRFSNKGDVFFNNTIGGRPTYSNGDVWIDGNGHSAASIKGNTASRPKGVGASDGILDQSRDIGFQYFDTTLGKPIFVKAIANDGTVTWVDATGTTV